MKNKLYIDKEALSALRLLKSNLLYPVVETMSNAEMHEINKTGLYKNCSFPCPFLLNPSGRRNQEIIKNAYKNEEIILHCEGEDVGSIRVSEQFLVDTNLIIKQMGANAAQKDGAIKRIGRYAISGKTSIFENPIDEYKTMIANKINKFCASKITGIFFNINPMHKVHEKLIRDELSSADLVIIFLLKNYHGDFLDYETRRECIDYALENFIISEKIAIVPVDSTFLFFGDNRHVLYWLIASNFGCTRLLFGSNHPHLGVYFDDTKQHSIFDSLKGVQIDVQIIDEYVYCTKCNFLSNIKSCPHGHHHHISYKPEVILNFFKLGLLPPTIFVRKEISALILKRLFSAKSDLIKSIYYELLPNYGLYPEDIVGDFYQKLVDMYRIYH